MAKKEITGSLANYLPVPGETIEELLESNNLSQADLALRTGLSKKHINQLIKGKKRITTETASKLSNVFTTLNPSFWNNLQRIYDEQIQEIKDKENISDEEKKIAKSLPYASLYQWKYFKIKNPDIYEKVEVFRYFLQVSNLKNVPESYNMNKTVEAFRKSDKVTTNPYIMSIWIQMCLKSDVKDTIPFDRSKLKESIPLIKEEITRNDINKEIKNLKEIFKSCGISFSVIHSLTGAPVQGYIRLIKDHILLCVTLRQKYEDIFWFTIMHEIGHLLHITPSTNGLIDYSQNEEIDLSSEKEADDFAAKQLISNEDFNKFTKSDINKESIIKFAKNEGVTPGIVVGRLGHSDSNYFRHYSSLRNKIELSN